MNFNFHCKLHHCWWGGCQLSSLRQALGCQLVRKISRRLFSQTTGNFSFTIIFPVRLMLPLFCTLVRIRSSTVVLVERALWDSIPFPNKLTFQVGVPQSYPCSSNHRERYFRTAWCFSNQRLPCFQNILQGFASICWTITLKIHGR